MDPFITESAITEEPLVIGSVIIDDPFGMSYFTGQQKDVYVTDYDDHFGWLLHSHAIADESVASPQHSANTNLVTLSAPADPLIADIYPTNSHSNRNRASSQTSLKFTCLLSQMQSQLQDLEEGC